MSAVVQPLRQAIAHAVALAKLDHRPFVVIERKRFPACRQRQGIAVRPQPCLLQVRAGRHKLAVALHARAAPVDGDRFAAARCPVVHVEIGPGVIDDTLPVAAWVARVKVLVVRMAAQVGALGRAAVQIADAFVIAHKIDARSQPHGRGDVAVQLRQQADKLPVAAAVDPQVARCTAPIALPACRVTHPTADDYGSIRPERNRPCRAHGQLLHGAVGGVHRYAEDAVDAVVNLVVAAGEKHRLPIGAPAQDLAQAVEIRQAPRAAATGRHQVDFRPALFPPGKRQPLAVGRKRRVVCLTQVAGEPPGDAALARHSPEVILGHKDDGILADAGKAIVTGSHGHLGYILNGKGVGQA